MENNHKKREKCRYIEDNFVFYANKLENMNEMENIFKICNILK